ncbi:MAG TPA: START domain-containing protein [Agitococcus sp.]|nr:START domain-containing protein [Agitococcus sp.]
MIRPLLSKLIVLTAITTVPLSVVADVDDLRNTQKSNANEWRLHKNDARHKIKVYVKNEEGQKLRSFKVEGIIDAPLETLLRIQSDVENYARWYFEIAEVKLLKKVSDKEFYFYLVHDAPIGLPKRDVILRTVIEPMSKKQPYVQLRMTSVPDYMPPRPPYVRMEAENYIVRYTPLSKTQTLREVEGFINPGGSSPAWAINFVSGKGPYTNMMGIRRMSLLPQYADSKEPLPYTFFE